MKATANKGYVFAGWYEDDDYTVPYDSSVTDYRNPSYSYTVGEEDKTFYARFVPVAEDANLNLSVNGVAVSAGDDPLKSFVAEGDTCWQIAVDSSSLPKVSVKGLPAGMKFTAKALTVKATKTEPAYNVPANAIYGTSSKPGVYTVTVKLTNTTVKKAIEKKFTIEVPNFTAADHLFRNDGEYYIANDVGDKYSIYVGVMDYNLPKLRLNGAGSLKITGLPAGLKYNAGAGTIEGVATKDGNYTVYLTVGKLVSTFTIEVKPLPD